MRNIFVSLAIGMTLLFGDGRSPGYAQEVVKSAEEVPLVIDHKATAVVVRPKGNLQVKGRKLERMAVDDFCDYIEKSTGARLTVTENAEEVVAGQSVVVLGVVGSVPKRFTVKPPKPLKRHAFYYEAGQRRLTILGADPRGLANGVHWFLRQKIGVRWYMSTELGEEVPTHANLTLKPEQITIDPEFEWIRFMGNERELPDEVVWGVRHGDDLWDEDFRDHWNFQKNWMNLLPLTRENVEKHPDWWAREEGKPPVYHDELNVCVSNPEVIQQFV
ncbi:MAG: hypothetical protein HRT46_11785, partial [Deltaproteobacteria bacterium]|nr:hypothetical protein [Deltaproteobacteria bacterium]